MLLTQYKLLFPNCTCTYDLKIKEDLEIILNEDVSITCDYWEHHTDEIQSFIAVTLSSVKDAQFVSEIIKGYLLDHKLTFCLSDKEIEVITNFKL